MKKEGAVTDEKISTSPSFFTGHLDVSDFLHTAAFRPMNLPEKHGRSSVPAQKPADLQNSIWLPVPPASA
jgi:hypothetical protein